MKTAKQRASTLAKAWDFTSETREHVADELKAHEDEARADERAKVTAYAAACIECFLPLFTEGTEQRATFEGVIKGLRGQ